MKILITDFAAKKIEEIYFYYAQEASLRVADRLIKSIFEKINSLKKAPLIGSPDEYLALLKKGHRKIYLSHYKIVYRIKGELIYVTDVFDSRQHPAKQKNDK
jgi:plasmid stabilization system protein ParE